MLSKDATYAEVLEQEPLAVGGAERAEHRLRAFEECPQPRGLALACLQHCLCPRLGHVHIRPARHRGCVRVQRLCVALCLTPRTIIFIFFFFLVFTIFVFVLVLLTTTNNTGTTVPMGLTRPGHARDNDFCAREERGEWGHADGGECGRGAAEGGEGGGVPGHRAHGTVDGDEAKEVLARLQPRAREAWWQRRGLWRRRKARAEERHEPLGRRGRERLAVDADAEHGLSAPVLRDAAHVWTHRKGC